VSNFWLVIRVIDFVLVFVCFWVLMYRAANKLAFHPLYFSWDRMANLVWCFAVTFSLGEVLYQNIQGGIRVLVTTFAILFQAWVVFFKSPYVTKSILEGRE
jgi:hypothetical protein